MDLKKLDEFKQQLLIHRNFLFEWFSGKSIKRQLTFGLHPTDKVDSVISKCEPVTVKIDQALERIESGDFGKCDLCDGGVEEERLALDFTTCVCLAHYSDLQIKELENDLELAAKVQKQLFPQEIPKIPGIQLAVRSEPARIVGGDYFDFFLFRNSMQALTLADVMGKGLPASMLMSNLQASLRILGPENDKLEKTATRLNELFRYNLKTIKFITVILAAIDISDRHLIYCNAGHNPPLWYRHALNKFERLDPTGPAIGILSDPVFKTKQIKFDANDIILFYTDGLSEAYNHLEEFGEERLQNFIVDNKKKTAQQLLANLFLQIKKYSTTSLDDLTAILVKIEDG